MYIRISPLQRSIQWAFIIIVTERFSLRSIWNRITLKGTIAPANSARLRSEKDPKRVWTRKTKAIHLEFMQSLPLDTSLGTEDDRRSRGWCWSQHDDTLDGWKLFWPRDAQLNTAEGKILMLAIGKWQHQTEIYRRLQHVLRCHDYDHWSVPRLFSLFTFFESSQKTCWSRTADV